MKANLKQLKKTTAIVAVALGALGATSSAVAAPALGLVQSVIEIQNFVLANNATGVTLNAGPLGDFAAFAAFDDGSVSATLNGVPAAGNIAVIAAPPSPPMDLLQATIGVNPYGQNDFGQHVSPPAVTSNYARSDQKLEGVLVDGIPAVFPSPNFPGLEPSPAYSGLVSEVALNGTGQGTANTTSGTAGTAIFTLANAGIKVRIAFDANPWLYAQLQPALIGRASMSLSFELRANNNLIFSWTPDGSVNPGSIFGGTEVADGYDLTNAVTASLISNGPNCAPFGGDCQLGGTGYKHFEAFTDALPAFDEIGRPILYDLTFNQTTTANLTVIPEPGSLALLGSALALLGFGRSRKSRAA